MIITTFRELGRKLTLCIDLEILPIERRICGQQITRKFYASEFWKLLIKFVDTFTLSLSRCKFLTNITMRFYHEKMTWSDNDMSNKFRQLNQKSFLVLNTTINSYWIIKNKIIEIKRKLNNEKRKIENLIKKFPYLIHSLLRKTLKRFAVLKVEFLLRRFKRALSLPVIEF